MVAKVRYDSFMKRLILATVAVSALVLVPALWAQINGVPASVTSIGFGGHFNQPPGIPASVTSIGPLGLVPGNTFFPPNCCINPLFPVNPNPPLFPRHHGGRGHGRNHDSFFNGGLAVYPVAYPVPYPVPVEDTEVQEPEDYSGGPTIFDRRGPGTAYRGELRSEAPPRDERSAEAASEPTPPAVEAPVPDQPKTVLIFKDGHQAEVKNYAIVGDTLYDLSEGRRHKIPLSDLDLTATARENDDRGIDFKVPPSAKAD
ncbi:MAG TPA: hypothetical protein VMT28_01070 [Terriglobales bacterium]|jgi:hypothetical protein|nr:hypothetical protein [Terriglobales bacterium]